MTPSFELRNTEECERKSKESNQMMKNCFTSNHRCVCVCASERTRSIYMIFFYDMCDDDLAFCQIYRQSSTQRTSMCISIDRVQAVLSIASVLRERLLNVKINKELTYVRQIRHHPKYETINLVNRRSARTHNAYLNDDRQRTKTANRANERTKSECERAHNNKKKKRERARFIENAKEQEKNPANERRTHKSNGNAGKQ